MVPDSEGFLRPVAVSQNCVGCGRCRDACPILQSFEARVPLGTYAAQHTDEAVRWSSSSGGVFSAFAEEILASGGVVYGAAVDSALRVAHRGVESLDALKVLRGSKYVQSDLDGVFREVRAQLRSGRRVLFSGTPCQIAGLGCFLGQVPESLVCIDFICHGVPSPMVFERWKAFMEHLYRSRIKDVAFRRKDDGWHRFSLAFTFEDARVYRGNVKEEPYLRGFLSNLFLRRACHDCRFKGLRGFSDVTIADYWGVKKTFPEWDDDRGTSLVLVNNEKGARLFSACSARMRRQAVDYADAAACNPAISRTSAAHRQRQDFFDRIDHWPIEKLFSEYVQIAWRRRLWWVLERLRIRWQNRRRKP